MTCCAVLVLRHCACSPIITSETMPDVAACGVNVAGPDRLTPDVAAGQVGATGWLRCRVVVDWSHAR